MDIDEFQAFVYLKNIFLFGAINKEPLCDVLGGLGSGDDAITTPKRFHNDMKTRFNVANNLSDSVVGGNGLKPKYRRAVVLFTLYTVAVFLIVFQDFVCCV